MPGQYVATIFDVIQTLDERFGQIGALPKNGDKQRRRRGCDFGGLEYDGVAGHERGRDFPDGQSPREIPRRDKTDHANGTANGVGKGVADFARHGLAVHAIALAREKFEEGNTFEDF